MTAIEQAFFWITIFTYVGSTLGYAYRFVLQKTTGRRWEQLLLGTGFGANLITMAIRKANGGHLLAGLNYEDGLLIAALTVLVFLVCQKKMPSTWPLALVCIPFAFLMLGFGYVSVEDIKPLRPAFISRWMVVHAIFALMGTACFVFALGTNVAYLLKNRFPEGSEPPRLAALPSQEVLKDLGFRLVLFGFVGWTVMIISGAFWAKDAYDIYWSWDPVETWSLVSWLAWGIYLHFHFTFKQRGKLLAWLCIVSFLVSVVTIWGIELITPKTYHNLEQIMGFKLQTGVKK